MSEQDAAVTTITQAVHALQQELATLRAERDDYRTRWLRQVDITDRMRARMAADASAMGILEAMGRE